jgi:putative ATP-dependent endonuclease of OLD family
MKLSRAKITNFRSIGSAEIVVGEVTRLIGANGSGKSTFLRALELFYSAGTPVISPDDFHNRTGEDIEVTLTFEDLDQDEVDKFGNRLDNKGCLSVTRVFSADSKKNGRYFGSARRCAAFAGVRNTDGRDKTAAYKALREVYPDLRDGITKMADVEDALKAWEDAFPEKCQPSRDDGQFFGFQNVAQGKLGDSTALVYIPAVRDASADASDGKASVVTRLLDLIVKSAIEARAEIRTFRSEVDAKFKELMSPSKLTELGDLAGVLSGTLGSFYSRTNVLLNWRESPPLAMPFPAADMRVDDDGFESPVDRTGHGLQRALIITLLQHLAFAARHNQSAAQGEEDGMTDAPLPGLILAIEEPELYQHPTKQRHIASVLEKLARGEIPGVASSTQVIFTTHSPLFVSMESFSEVRMVRRQAAAGAPRCCAISTADLDDVANRIGEAWGAPAGKFTADSLKPRLHVVDGAVAEGFFAGVSVLVEGVSDRAALHAVAALKGINLGAEEIAVLPCGGKSIMDKPFQIFTGLGVPTFAMWDCDRGKPNEVKNNRALQHLVGIPESQIRDTCSVVGANHACFDLNLEATMKAELGDDRWNRILDGLKEKYGVTSKDDAQKIPKLMSELLQAAESEGARCATLEAILDRIMSLKAQAVPPSVEVSAAA